MRWFKHLSGTHENEDLSEFIEKFGPEGYGVFWLILEKIALLMDQTDRCSATYTAQKWCRILKIRAQKLITYLTYLEQKCLLSVTCTAQKLNRSSTEVEQKFNLYSTHDQLPFNFCSITQNCLITIFCPKLLKYRDEYSEKRKKKSVMCRDTVGTLSGHTPDQDRDRDRDRDRDTDTEAYGSKEFKNCGKAVVVATTTSAGADAPAFDVIAADFQNVKNYFLEESPAFFPDIPTTLKFWSSPKLRGMLSVWTREGVTLEDVQAAVTHQRAKDDFKENPYYYANAAIEFARERKKFGKYQTRGAKSKLDKKREEADRNVEIALQQARERGEIE